jgi:hypothetical protein
MENEKTQALINAFEPKRLAARRSCRHLQIFGWVFLSLGLLLFVGVFTSGENGAMFFILGLGILFLGVLILSISRLAKRKFQKSLSDEVEEEVNQVLFPNAVVNHNIGVSYETMMGPGFFAPPDRYIGTDLRTSDYHGISFEQGHYCLQERTASNNSHGRSGSTYVDYAMGTLYHFAFERDFGQIVKVIEKEGTLSFNVNKLKKVETEYIEFNRKFMVLASDETTCFFLLTPQIQEKLMSFEKMFKGQFYLAFIGRDLFICANNSDGSMPIPWKEPLSIDNMQPAIESMALPAVFIDLLGLSLPKFEKNGGIDVNKPS